MRGEKEEIAYCLLQLGIGVEARLPHDPQPDARTIVVTTGLGIEEIWVSRAIENDNSIENNSNDIKSGSSLITLDKAKSYVRPNRKLPIRLVFATARIFWPLHHGRHHHPPRRRRGSQTQRTAKVRVVSLMMSTSTALNLRREVINIYKGSNSPSSFHQHPSPSSTP